MRKKSTGPAVPLKDLRAAAGYTQQQLADASCVNIRQIQRVELGSSDAGNLSGKNLLAIADALGVDPHDLIASEPEDGLIEYPAKDQK